MNKIKRIKNFLLYDVWTTDLEDVSKKKQLLVRSSQMLMLSIRSFREDKLNVNASALTYFTLLSIVPVLALGFGIAKGFGLESILEDEIASNLAGQEQAKEYILQFTKSMLDTTRGGLVAGIGVVLLLWSVVKLLTNIERAFNTVWEVKKGRTIARKFTDYTSIVMLGPLIMILSSSITIFISTQFSRIGEQSMFGFMTPLSYTFAKFIPFVLIWILFTLIYVVMPSTKVRFRSALIAGILAGTAFQIFQGLYVEIQSSFTRLSAIYGSFAALPLFLMWLRISWFVVLLGAEVSFVIQNLKLKSSAMSQDHLSDNYQKKASLYIAKKIIDAFKKGEKAPDLIQLTENTRMPFVTVERIVNRLHECGIVSKVLIDENKISYQPALSTENLSIAKILDALDNQGKDESKYFTQSDFTEIEQRFDTLIALKQTNPANILLKDL